ncbi:MAG: hypothetical protein LQ352_001609 [Teloschistes flavicans]|nr:MAG: hypothetical protein LQ352_001609 [Teloschistes flavicans]
MDDETDFGADFAEVFAFDPIFAYGEQTINKIVKSRRSMDNELFIDLLLKTLNIQGPSDVYPPKSNQDLRKLHRQILKSPSPAHHQQSLLYYILKDVPSLDKHTASPASTFAKSVHLPRKYRIFIDGIWLMDRGKFKEALDHLTEPVLIPTFPDKIISTLCTHRDRADKDLALAYYHTVKPAIESYKVLETLFSRMAASGVAESFFWSRRHPDPFRRKLFEQLVKEVLDAPEGEERARRSVELIYLPFDAEEEGWFEEFLTEGKGRSIPRAKDALRVRAIATGRGGALVDQGSGGLRGEGGGGGMEWSGSSFEHGLMTPPR